MPLLYILLFGWHIVSRLFVLYIHLTSTDQAFPLPEGDRIGWVFHFIAWNGIGFFLLLLVVCFPALCGRSMPMLYRITAFNGIALGFFGAIHDSFFGFGMAYGYDSMMFHVGTPLRDASPLPQIMVFVFAAGYSLAVPILLAVSQWRLSSGECRRKRKSLLWFPDLP